ncbi:MAG TPA: hypothetical protein VL742_08615 [Casimicrobiaceae bacterium]|nr:hypothetical protein [Casimicrobiaceae bacterium]
MRSDNALVEPRAKGRLTTYLGTRFSERSYSGIELEQSAPSTGRHAGTDEAGGIVVAALRDILAAMPEFAR